MILNVFSCLDDPIILWIYKEQYSRYYFWDTYISYLVIGLFVFRHFLPHWIKKHTPFNHLFWTLSKANTELRLKPPSMFKAPGIMFSMGISWTPVLHFLGVPFLPSASSPSVSFLVFQTLPLDLMTSPSLRLDSCYFQIPWAKGVIP